MTAANAATYTFTFRSTDAQLTAKGEITVDAVDQVTAVSGVISGLVNQTITAVTVNPGFPSASYSPDGSFIYDNVYHPTGMPFDVNGLLFVTTQNPGSYWNLWGNSPGDYSLFEIGRNRQLSDPGERNSERGCRARTIDLGDASFGLCGAGLFLWPAAPPRAAPRARPRLKAARLQTH